MSHENNEYLVTPSQQEGLRLGRETLRTLQAVTAASPALEDDAARQILEAMDYEVPDTNTLALDFFEDGNPVKVLLQDLTAGEDSVEIDTTELAPIGSTAKISAPLELLGIAVAGVGQVSKTYFDMAASTRVVECFSLLRVVSTDPQIDEGIIIRQRIHRSGPAHVMQRYDGEESGPNEKIVSYRDTADPELARRLTGLILTAQATGRTHISEGPEFRASKYLKNDVSD